MKITAIDENDLPFTDAGKAACAAARTGEARMKLPGIPGEFNVRFVGTGVATIPENTKNVFNTNHEQTQVNMHWYQNKFVGSHWFLGDFEIDLAEDKDSTGVIDVLSEEKFGARTINVNNFYFDFKFKRFPFLNMANQTPIAWRVSESDVSGGIRSRRQVH